MQEIKEYWTILKKEKFCFSLILGAWVLVGLLVFLFSPINYKTSLSVDVARVPSEAREDFDYDLYYFIQANDMFANTVISWIKDPVFIDKIFGDNGQGFYLKNNIKENFFIIKKDAPAHFVVEFKTEKVFESMNIYQALKSNLNKKIALTRRDQSREWFELIITGPVIEKQEFGYKIMIIFTVLGLFFGFFGALITHYWRNLR